MTPEELYEDLRYPDDTPSFESSILRIEVPGAQCCKCGDATESEDLRYNDIVRKLMCMECDNSDIDWVEYDEFITMFNPDYQFSYPDIMERHYPEWKTVAKMFQFILNKPYMSRKQDDDNDDLEEPHKSIYGFNTDDISEALITTFAAAYHKYSKDVVEMLDAHNTIFKCSGCDRLLVSECQDCDECDLYN